MKKWNNAELVALDINMTASGGTDSKVEKEKKNHKNGKEWQGPGNPPTSPSDIIEDIIDVFDGNKSDTTVDGLS